MSNSLDDFLPKTRFQLPGGACFSIGTMWDDDSCRQLVLFQYFTAGSLTPVVEFAVSPNSADAVITAFQDSANQARYISGQRTYVYPPPVPEVLATHPNKKRRKSRKNDTMA